MAPLNGTLNNGQLSTAKANATRILVKYRQSFYDITDFMRKHPGGINTLKGLSNADMTGRFLKAPPHSDAAMYLMKEYKVHRTQDKGDRMNTHNDQGGEDGVNRVENGSELIEELEESDVDKEDKNNNQLDESMEHLVDWSKAMLPQIPKIAKYYDEWVHKPVDRDLRLFGPWYLEFFTKTPWWIIPLFWIPVIIKCIADGFGSSWQAANIGMLMLLSLYFLVGILFWTLLEYSLHRWVFHMKIDGNAGAWACTLHFVIHGLHHKVPFDPMRLVFPPLPGVILASIIYTPLSFIAPNPKVLLAGALLGYMCYDLMHYYLHYGNPSFQHMYNMKRYHYQHHFAYQDLGYGISSPLWDIFFNTRISLRKLGIQLRWK